MDCVDCIKMDLQDRNKYDEAYCSELKKYTSLTGSCRYFSPRQSSSGGCYLTTAMCEVLGLSDNCDILETLRGYRDWYLKGDERYRSLLIEYEVIGPIISGKIYQDPCRKSIVSSMKNDYIDPAISYIFEERYEEAADSYIAMTNMLKDYYDIKVPKTERHTEKNKIKEKTLTKF